MKHPILALELANKKLSAKCYLSVQSLNIVLSLQSPKL